MFLSANASCPVHLKAMKGAVRIGEERVAAHPGEQPARARLHGLGVGIETDRCGRDEQLTRGLGLPRLEPGGVVAVRSAAVPELGEHERERGVGLRVPVAVDVDPVDPVGVEFRFHQERRHRAHAVVYGLTSMIRIVFAAIIRRREDVQVGEVQARVVPGKLQVGRAVVVRHDGSSPEGGRGTRVMPRSHQGKPWPLPWPGPGRHPCGRMAHLRYAYAGPDPATVLDRPSRLLSSAFVAPDPGSDTC